MRAYALTCLIVSSAALFVCPAPGAAQAHSSSSAIPVDARQRSYGSGWERNRGFRKAGAGCAVLRVPDHGYINHSGDDWSCEGAFLRTDGACVASPEGTVPPLKQSTHD